jgi:hypothetical protein
MLNEKIRDEIIEICDEIVERTMEYFEIDLLLLPSKEDGYSNFLNDQIYLHVMERVEKRIKEMIVDDIF